jgi:hypothetical protein
MDRVARDLAVVRAEIGDIKRQMAPFLSRHSPGNAARGIIGLDWHTRTETDEPTSAIHAALWDLGTEEAADSLAVRALFAALRDLDGAFRDLRALRLDLATIAGDEVLTKRFRGK